MGEVFRGVRIGDWALAAALTAAGTLLMIADITWDQATIAAEVAAGRMVHGVDSQSWWMLPVFLAAILPILWWRRNLLLVTGISAAAMVSHLLIFGWTTRCGAGLPLAWALAILAGLTLDRRRSLIAMGLNMVLLVGVIAKDSSTGTSLLPITMAMSWIVWAIARAARSRVRMGRELKRRTEELRALRDERAALEVADDRARISRQLDGLLQERLGQLTRAAESAGGLDAEASRRVLASIEDESRRTLDDMREIVGMLRGGDVALAPAPTVAHLKALLARRGSDARLAVSGDPRSLPATVGLSAYRIVEHLLGVLADQPDARIEVGVRFADDALELSVRGPVERHADMRAAVARATERARLLGGSVEARTSHGLVAAVAQLPVAR